MKTKQGTKEMQGKTPSTFVKRVEDTIRRHYFGVLNPEEYFQRSVSLRILGLLPTVIDNCLYDVENIGGIPYRDPKMLKLQREANVAVERLLKHVHKDHVDTYKYLGDNEEQARRNADGFADVSAFLTHMLELVCGYCSNGNDEWRLTKLMETAENLVSDEAHKTKVAEVRKYCLNQLKEWKIDGVEEAVRRGIQPVDLRLSVPTKDYDTNPAKIALSAIK